MSPVTASTAKSCQTKMMLFLFLTTTMAHAYYVAVKALNSSKITYVLSTIEQASSLQFNCRRLTARVFTAPKLFF